MAFSIGIKKHIERWQQAGLIDEATAGLLRKDVEKSRSGFGLGGILAVLGAVLLGAAIISLIAANWEAMPRLLRVVMIICVLFAGYGGGAWREARGDRIFSQAFYLIAAISFGAGIALVGQMYHLSGEATDAALLWAAGTMVAALCLRSTVLTAASAAITGFYLFTALDGGNERQTYIWLLPALLFISAGLVWYTGAKVARHFIALVLIVYVFAAHEDFDSGWMLWLAAFGGAALFIADSLPAAALERLTGWSRAIGAYGFLMLLLVLSYFQFDRFDNEVSGQVAIGFGILACTVAGLVISGHRNQAVRWMSYTGFSLEVLYLAFKTIGTLIGTASFFLCAGVLVLLLAAFVVRMERRLQRRMAQAGGAGA